MNYDIGKKCFFSEEMREGILVILEFAWKARFPASEQAHDIMKLIKKEVQFTDEEKSIREKIVAEMAKTSVPPRRDAPQAAGL